MKQSIEQILEQNVWGIVCDKCGGGGADGQNKCSKCKGTGIYNWHYELAIEKIDNLISQARREVIDDIDKIIDKNSVDGMADYDGIASDVIDWHYKHKLK